MVAGRDLGDDAAEALVRHGLRRDDVRADLAPVDHRGAGVVAGRLDREDHGITPPEASPAATFPAGCSARVVAGPHAITATSSLARAALKPARELTARAT